MALLLVATVSTEGPCQVESQGDEARGDERIRLKLLPTPQLHRDEEYGGIGGTAADRRVL